MVKLFQSENMGYDIISTYCPSKFIIESGGKINWEIKDRSLIKKVITFQWMEIGDRGVVMVNVQKHVAVEHN